MNSRSLFNVIVSLFVAFGLALLSMFNFFTIDFFMSPFVLIFVVIIFLFLIAWFVNVKMSELVQEVNKLRGDNKRINEKFNIYERLNKLEVEVEYAKKK
jgi:amino acid permease